MIQGAKKIIENGWYKGVNTKYLNLGLKEEIYFYRSNNK